MKKTILFLFLLVTALVFSGCCLKHERVIDETIAPTCTESGLTAGEHCAKCEKIFVAQETIPATGHSEVTDDAVAPTCTEAGLTAGTHCEWCGDVFVAQKVVDALGHTEVQDIGYAPTCTLDGMTDGSHCSVCLEVLIPQEVIVALGHTEVVDIGYAASCEADGLTDGKHCGVCTEVLVAQEVIAALGHSEEVLISGFASTCAKQGITDAVRCSTCNLLITKQEILDKKEHTMIDGRCKVCGHQEIDFTDISIYESDYGYNYLGTLENGKNMQAFYRDMDKQLKQFHSDINANAVTEGEIPYVVTRTNYKKHNLTLEQAQMTWVFYRNDRPLFYWMSYNVWWNTGNGVIITRTEKAYANGSERAKYNQFVYESIESYVSLAYGETSPYRIALLYHDAILQNCQYAYASSNKSPENAQWAHSILGAFEKKSFVCEVYAKLFQLLLTVSGVENVYITGKGGNDYHCWNLVQLDDGEWYWCDLTWDDTTIEPDYFHNYFCINDKQFVNWRDSGIRGNETFLSKHRTSPKKATAGNPLRVMYTIPERSANKFDHPELLTLRESFSVGGCTYAVVQYNKVYLVKSQGNETLIVPKYVSYAGDIYEVIGACAITSDGFLQSGLSVTDDAVKVVVPSSVKYVSIGAFAHTNIQEVVREK